METMIKKIDNRSVIVNIWQAEIIESLLATRAGGFARLHNYTPDAAGKRYLERPCYDITVIARFSVARMYTRILDALENMQFSEVSITDDKLASLSSDKLLALFNERKQFLIDRYNGQRENSHTAAHARNYVRIGRGIVGHLETKFCKDARKMLPVYDDADNVSLRSIMLEGLAVNRTTHRNGAVKPVNSRLPTRMGNAIERALPRVGSAYRRFSLTPETVERVSIDKQTILPTELQSLID